jgi:GntR family transcriptional repressor for pyruvate dehydrogenase complex
VSPPLGEKALRAVSREKLRERTAAELREYVLVNRLAPGTQLPAESELAATLGVSRNVLRQAVASLEGLGMLRVAHGSGTYVADPADSEIFQQIAAWIGTEKLSEPEYFEVRAIWERGIYALAMQRATAGQLDRLDALASAMADSADPDELGSRHAEFHQVLLEMTGNSFLVTMGTILARFFWEFGYRNAHVRKPPQDQLLAGHREIADLLRRRDPAMVEEVVEAHLSPDRSETEHGESQDGESQDGESQDGESQDGESQDGESQDGRGVVALHDHPVTPRSTTVRRPTARAGGKAVKAGRSGSTAWR